MKQWLLALGVLSPMLVVVPVRAQTATPNFTQGSMTQTSTTEMTITETVSIERFGGAYSSYSGTNTVPDQTDYSKYTVHTAGGDFQYEVTTRTAGIIETEDITREIEQTTVTNTLSIFSQ